MKLLIDSLWRAIGYCFRPSVIALSLLPLLIAGAIELLWTYNFWEDQLRWVDAFLGGIPGLSTFLHWLAKKFGPEFNTVVDSLVVIAIATPLFVMLTLVIGAVWMTPAAVSITSRRRFPALERRHGGSWLAGLFFCLRHMVVALGLTFLTLPLWLIPPLGLLLPTVIWGRLAARVMSYDALAEHATAAERSALLSAHAWPLLMMGMATGFLCSTPSLLWVVSIPAVIAFPFVMVGVLWVYTMVFTFSALWFTHYCLKALSLLRAAEASMHETRAAMPGAAEVELIEEVPPHERFGYDTGESTP